MRPGAARLYLRAGAMARVTADAEIARALAMLDGLHVAAYEGIRSHALAGSTVASAI